MKTILILTTIILMNLSGFGQFLPDSLSVTRATVFEGDTIPYIYLSEASVFAPPKFKSRTEARNYTRLVRYVKKVYPYAIIASSKLNEYDALLSQTDSEKEQKRLMKQAEKEIRSEFEGELKKLTFTQGKILIKLIDRETGSSSYDLVKELRGKLIAGLWQSLGRIFGYNLKVKYDPKGKDKNIEYIVQQLEAGSL